MLLTFSLVQNLFAQEMVVPLQGNAELYHKGNKNADIKKTRTGLPFIDDFAYTGPYPNSTLWTDSQAYVNNTMGYLPVNRGVATLDGLNKYGRPYFNSPFSSGTADSLTSTYINLSAFTAANNIYMSFYFQPQGLGFAPENNDSLFLYFRNNNNDWVRMWETRGTPLQAFQIKILPLTDMQYMHDSFQFRFVNIASLNTNDDIWNIDYIKIDVNRNPADSIMNDVGFTEEPGSILSKYSSMPYRHFQANQANERSASQLLELRNLYDVTKSITVNHVATEFFSGTPLNAITLPPANIGAKSTLNQSVPTYNISYTAPNNYSKVVVRNKYFINSLGATDRKLNDTITRDAVFDNYFAYDDGSAEKSYFLLPANNFPSKTALEFTLNQADTVQGLYVHFGAQVPTAAGKFFSVVLYKKLKGPGTDDTIIFQQDFYTVQYENDINGFSGYGFDTPVALDAGVYYMGITQPANFGSDSIYYGLDVNNNTNIQHLFYNVDGTWLASGVNGSVMMRPAVGQHFTPTTIPEDPAGEIVENNIYPNPVNDRLYFETGRSAVKCRLFDINGRQVSVMYPAENRLQIAGIPPGLYVLYTDYADGKRSVHKILKR